MQFTAFPCGLATGSARPARRGAMGAGWVRGVVGLILLCWCHAGGLGTALVSAEEIQFNRDIRPILSDKCFACHGPDAAQRQADLRLDLEQEATQDRGGYAAVVPGQPAESALIERIFADDPDVAMPPPDHLKRLTSSEKQLLRDWIEQGAVWEQHWAWIPPQPVTPPELPSELGVNHPIDHFVRARLLAKGIEPSPAADRTTLIRRLYFDLIGLPPSPEEVAAFVDDPSPDAYERLVDRLLASPHYGERMAIPWLDLVRYADTVGYHGDQDVSISPYRDYVIASFNSNKPFDRFTREQLAGDLLENPTAEQLIASGYNRLGMMSAEGGVQPEEYLVKYAADRVRTTATVWLGVTLGCAECHDHKFDPFSADDFYSFAAFFADIQERGLYSGANSTGDWGPQIDVPDDELPKLLEPIDRELDSLREGITLNAPGLDAEQAAWEARVRDRTFDWTAHRPLSMATANQPEHSILDDGSVLLGGASADTDAYVVVLELPAGRHSGLRLEALPDPSLPRQGPGRAGNGNFVITQFLITRGDRTDRIEDLKQSVSQWPDDLRAARIPLAGATATFEQADSSPENPYGKWAAAAAIDEDRHGPGWGWATMPESGVAQELVVNFEEPLELAEPERVTVILQQYHGHGGHVLGRFRLATASADELVADPFRGLPPEIKEWIALEPANRTADQRTRLAEYHLSIAERFATQRKRIAELQERREAVVARHTRTSLITVSVPPREMRVLKRGNWMDKTGEFVQPHFPSSLVSHGLARAPATGTERLTRLDLANWLVSPDNPLTARVFVNRLWKLYFGTGLSKVLDDVGSQGEPPSHPELLDFLATEFVDSGWDIQHMVRLIVTSEAYRQSSQPREELAERDPYNRLLARQSRFRLDAELLRDNALAVSGLLVREIGGRSVKPYQPAGLLRHLNFPPRVYQADNGEAQFRRGLYTHWQRQFLHPALKSFDAPAREESTCERPRSNTPVGALVLLNDPSYVEAARQLAARGMRSAEPQDRSRWLFRQAVSRWPNAEEEGVLDDLFSRHQNYYRDHPDEARQLVSTGISPIPTELDPAEWAAWTSVARAIMNTHEFITRR